MVGLDETRLSRPPSPPYWPRRYRAATMEAGAMRVGDDEFNAAVEATRERLHVAALVPDGEPGFTLTYKELSQWLRTTRQLRVHWRGRLMSLMLEEVCLREHDDGRRSLLSALVVAKKTGLPAAMFFDLASRDPYLRRFTDPKTFWLAECQLIRAEHHALATT